MSNNGDENLGEFKGSTKEAIADLKKDVEEIRDEVKALNRRFIAVVILLTLAVVERLPNLIQLVMAGL